ncbi:MAG: hypothetical protein QNJ16_08030 [Rhodobacter sp.]|nr:hypothetical protein [Rhodobacter sp.]
MRLLLASLLAFGWLTAAQAEIPGPTERVILTIGGELPEGNAPPAHEDDVNFSGYLDLTYRVAVAFDDAMLAAMPQHEVKATLLDTGREIAYTGPRLSELMKRVGAEGKSAWPMAFDGYQVEITWDHLSQYEPIVATHGDGVPLEVGLLGPTMIVYPVVEDKDLYDSFEALQVWAMFFIGIE